MERIHAATSASMSGPRCDTAGAALSPSTSRLICEGGLPWAARKLAEASADHPDVLAATEPDAAAVVEDVHNVGTVMALAPPIERLACAIDDSRLVGPAEAFVPSPQLCGVAKVRTESQARPCHRTVCRGVRGSSQEEGLVEVAFAKPAPARPKRRLPPPGIRARMAKRWS